METRRLRGDILVFLVLALAISCIFYALILSAGAAPGMRLYITGLMWSPALAALLTVRIRKLDLASLGWGWGATRWNLAGYLIPLGYAAIAYAFIWLAGFGGFADAANVAKFATMLGWTDAKPAIVVISYVLLMATTGIVSSMATALGEEIGWRGFLAPRMASLIGFTPSVFVVGLIWAAWHMPLLLFGSYNQGTEWWFSASCFTVMVLGVSMIAAWLRLRSGSLWPCAILHASHNLFIQGVFTPLTGERGSATAYAIDEFGFVLPLVVAGFAIWLWMRRNEAVSAASAAR
jgi:membrane protease YdiL (CAAX protease family)